MQNNESETVLEKLIELANLQRKRVLAMLRREEKSGFINPRVDIAMRVLAHLLLGIQKMRFDLGLDECHISRAEAAETHAKNERREYETYTAAEEIFERRFGSRHEVDKKPAGRDGETKIN